MALIYIPIFLIGIFFGSFSTLAIYRIPLKKNITHERSFCPNCNHKLSCFDLIPLFSFIILGGKCRYCKKKISIRYFIIELFFGIISLIIFTLLWKLRGILDYIVLIEFLGYMIIFEIIFLIIGIKFQTNKQNQNTMQTP